MARFWKHIALGGFAVVIAWSLPTRVDCYELGGECSGGRWELSVDEGGVGFSDYSAETRVATVKIASLAVKEYPLVGLGLGRFPDFYKSHRIELDLERIDPRVRITPHNSYIELAAELGLPAMIAFLVLIAVLLIKAGKNRSTAGVAIFSACAGLLSWMLFHDGFSDHLFWILLGCAASLGDSQLEFAKTGKELV